MVEMAFEFVDTSGPEPAERRQPRIHLLEWFSGQPVVAALCVHSRLDETGLAQYAEVFGNSRLRHAKLPFDLSNRLL